MAVSAQLHKSYLWNQKYLPLTNPPQSTPPLGTGFWVTIVGGWGKSNGAPQSSGSPAGQAPDQTLFLCLLQSSHHPRDSVGRALA